MTQRPQEALSVCYTHSRLLLRLKESCYRCRVHADEENQLMTLDASGKPVPLARLAPARVRTVSSNSPSMPSQKHRSSTSANKSTAASPKPGSTSKASKDRPAPIDIPPGVLVHMEDSTLGVLCRPAAVHSDSHDLDQLLASIQKHQKEAGNYHTVQSMKKHWSIQLV